MKIDAAVMREERKRRAWSQEQLAAVAGLGLRTVQRIEATGLASYESVKAIAAVLDRQVVDFDVTDSTAAAPAERREAPAKTEGLSLPDKSSSEWKGQPPWVRVLFFGSGLVRMDRRHLRMLEILEAGIGVLLAVPGLCGLFDFIVPRTAAGPLLVLSMVLFAAAYAASLHVRIGDRFHVWPWLGTRPRRHPARMAFAALCVLVLSMPVWS